MSVIEQVNGEITYYIPAGADGIAYIVVPIPDLVMPEPITLEGGFELDTAVAMVFAFKEAQWSALATGFPGISGGISGDFRGRISGDSISNYRPCSPFQQHALAARLNTQYPSTTLSLTPLHLHPDVLPNSCWHG